MLHIVTLDTKPEEGRSRFLFLFVAVIFLEAFGVSVASALSLYVVAILVIAAGFAFQLILWNNHRSETIIDERNNRISEKAAQVTLVVFFLGVFAVVVGSLTVQALGRNIPELAMSLDYLAPVVLAVLALYGVSYFVLSRRM